MKSRVGRFYIPRRDVMEQRQAVKTIMKQMVIVYAQADFMRDCIEYQAFSELFEEVDHGCVIPEYELAMDENLAVYSMRVR